MYDHQITDQISHYRDHKTYLPHIPEGYGKKEKKIFIIGESHYLPQKYNGQITAETWYKYPDQIYALISKDAVEWINTRGVIKFFSGPEKLAKGHRIFQNLHNAFSESFKGEKLFENAVYFNYFQRPAEIQGGSIMINKLDSQKALENLIALNGILEPHLIIFTSSKAFKNFNATAGKDVKKELMQIEHVPHPACAWWNKTSKRYGINSDGSLSTGKQKFQRIITTLNH